MDFKVTETLNDEQLQSFKEFRQSITELHGSQEAEDESRLLRFLVARDYDVGKATTMLSNNINWRRKFNIGDLTNNYKISELFEKYFPVMFIGFSKFGDAVAFIDFDIDLIGFSKSVSKHDFTLYVMYWMEFFCEALEKKSLEDKILHQTWIFILDFGQLALSQVMNKNGMDMLIDMLPIYEANYPERLKNAYVVDASMPFTIAYALLKPLLYEKTRAKVKVFGKNGWKEELKEIIDPDILPAFLGGKNTDPSYSKVVRKGGSTIPSSYYTSGKSKNSLSSKEGVRRYNVARRSLITIPIKVKESGSRIEWEFQTENHDIGFGIRFSSSQDEGEGIVVVPIQKMDTRVFCEMGLYHCEKPGTYTIIFDNSFSWFTSKELFVRVDLVEPDGHQKLCVTQQHT